MNVHFNDTQPGGAPAETLFAVLTDYSNYPSFNSSVAKVTVLQKDDEGAEFLADRTTKIGKQAHAFDCYRRDGGLVLERTYEGIEGSSTWTVRPVDAARSTLTIDGTMTVGLLRGLAMRIFLKRILYGTDFKPFIEEAERRAQRSRT
jgi:ribosome-associated toxin RatA of RatAB toxin-antitoxin module